MVCLEKGVLRTMSPIRYSLVGILIVSAVVLVRITKVCFSKALSPSLVAFIAAGIRVHHQCLPYSSLVFAHHRSLRSLPSVFAFFTPGVFVHRRTKKSAIAVS
jgi:hypothetical protein